MDFKNIARIRLASQQIVATKCRTAKEVVAWMGAMQAQDYNMAKWAIGLRLPASTDEIIQEAINNGEVLRTHILRPTWHFVSAEDIYWMLELTAPRMKTLQRGRQKELGLTQRILAKSNSIIAKALSGGKHLSREELMALLEKSGIDTGNQKSYHLMHTAELNGIVCSGKINEKKQTYALLEERVQKTKSLTREEALARLAQKYFTSHCPATLQDFTWWSGLSAIDARHALEMVKNNFISETIGAQTYWLTNSFSIPETNKTSVYLLPAYDEFIISYKDRSAVLPLEHNRKAVSNNGLFRPVILVNGKVTGLWKRTFVKDTVIVEAQFFEKTGKTISGAVEKESIKLGRFLGKKEEAKLIEI